MPKVSILIPVYNDEIFIEDLLKSILNQTFQNFECLIYNHGSTDNSQKMLENFSNIDKRIKIFVTHQNIGNGANNKLLQHATGEYIKFFCADDIMLPNCLEKQVSFFEDKKMDWPRPVADGRRRLDFRANQKTTRRLLRRLPGWPHSCVSGTTAFATSTTWSWACPRALFWPGP